MRKRRINHNLQLLREFKGQRDNNKNRHHEQNRKPQPQKEQKPSNITVRSFKAKKKEEQ